MTAKLQAEYALYDILLHNLLARLLKLVDERLITERRAASIAGIDMDHWTKYTFEKQLPTEEVVRLAQSGARSIKTMLFNARQLKHQLQIKKQATCNTHHKNMTQRLRPDQQATDVFL